MAEAINRQGHQLLQVVDSILKYTEVQTKSDLKPITKITGAILQRSIHSNFNYYQNKYNKPQIVLRFQGSDLIENKVLSIPDENFTDSVNSIVENAVKFSDAGNLDIIFKIVNEIDLIIQFKDEGIGIEKEKLDDIFKEFYQIESGHNRKFEGIGMGLAFARKLIHLMGGKIWCENNERKGVSFYIHIPNCVRKF
jgi:signal transduction histidine kinase